MNLGAFAGGLAGGLLAGEQLKQRRADSDLNKARAERENTEHEWKKQDRDNMQRFWKRVGSEVLMPTPSAVASPMTPAPGGAMAPAPESMALKPAAERPDYMLRGGFARGGLVSLTPKGNGIRGFAAGGMLALPDSALALRNAPAAYQAGMPAGGAATLPPQAQQAQPPAEQFDPRQEMQRQMLDGNLMSDPDKLNQIAQIGVEEGLGQAVLPWLEQAYTAKQKGMMTGAIKLMQGNVDAAIDDLKRGGMKLGDRPTKVVPDDPDDHRWKINVEGQGEQVMDVSHLLATTMDPEKYFDVHFKRGEARRKEAEEGRKDKELGFKEQELGLKARETEADIDYKRAQTRESGARADRYRSMGLAGVGGTGRGGGRSADRPESLNAAIKRFDDAINDLSSAPGEDNKPVVDPQKRKQWYTIANHYRDQLENALGDDLTAQELRIFTDRLHTFPLDDPAGQKAWTRQLLRRFGGDLPEEVQEQLDEASTPQKRETKEIPRGKTVEAPAAAPPPARGGLASTQTPERLALNYKNTKYYEPMLAIQRALQEPNLSVEDRRKLALQAQHIASSYEQEHGAKRR